VRRLLLALTLALAALSSAACEEPKDQDRVAGRSGFWTSREPAKGGRYRWRLLGIGAGLAMLTGAGMLALVRRANAERLARDAQQNQQ
jgi:hypothetical protein